MLSVLVEALLPLPAPSSALFAPMLTITVPFVVMPVTAMSNVMLSLDGLVTLAVFEPPAVPLIVTSPFWNPETGSLKTAVKRIGDAELAAMVTTPWNKTWPGFVAFHILHDEFLHHRGQLYAFARCCGAEPPFMWGYADNAPEYRPGAVAATTGG